MRIAISAFSFAPGHGSELGTGWAWAIAAAEHNDVTVFTSPNFRIETVMQLASSPIPRLRVEYLPIPALPWLRNHNRPSRLRYAAWQWKVRKRVAELHSARAFDVAHHLTWAVDWLPAGIIGIPGLASVWGPVGGTSPFPWRTASWLGRTGLAYEIARTTVSAAARRVVGDRTARRADVTIVQNKEVAVRFRRCNPLIEPNVAIDLVELGNYRDKHKVLDAKGNSVDTAVSVGRLVPLKGVAVAIDALNYPEMTNWRLIVLGDGPERGRLERKAESLGLADRVEFRGQVSRQEVFTELANANVLLAPSMHEAGGWAVAEAVAIGCPVITFDLGGPAVILDRCRGGVLVPLDRNAARNFAAAVNRVHDASYTQPVDKRRLPDLLDFWYQTAIERASEGASASFSSRSRNSRN